MKYFSFWPCLFSFRPCHMHLQSYLIRAGGQILRKKAEPTHQRIANNWFCGFQSWHTHQLGCICRSNSCRHWKQRWQNASLPESNAHMERLWLLPFTETQTSGRQQNDLMAGNNWPLAPYFRKTFQRLSRETRSYAFSRSTKHVKKSLPYSQDISKCRSHVIFTTSELLIVIHCFKVKIWFVVLQLGQIPHWPFPSFDSTIFRHFLSRHWAYTFPGKLDFFSQISNQSF